MSFNFLQDWIRDTSLTLPGEKLSKEDSEALISSSFKSCYRQYQKFSVRTQYEYNKASQSIFQSNSFCIVL